MSAYIINAAPMVLSDGTQDLSGTQLPRVPDAVPQHCPKFYLWTKKGPLIPTLASGVELTNLYGIESFDPRSKYFNHATAFATEVNKRGNSFMAERVVPADAGPAANIILWLDVLPTTVSKYERNSDGSIKLDTIGNPIIVGEIQGYKVKFVTSYRATEAEQQLFGQADIMAGDQMDPVTGVQSQRYPIKEWQVSSQGDWGKNVGFRIWAPTLESSLSMPVSMMAKERAYPFYFSSITRADAMSTPKIDTTIMGDQSVMFTFKEGVVDPLTDDEMYIGDKVLNSYQNLSDMKYPRVYGNFSTLGIYNENIAKLLADFHAAEAPFVDNFSDFTASTDDLYLFNFISGVSSQNVPYHSYQFVDDVDSVFLSEYTNVFAKGGSDGTLSDENFAKAVSARVVEYANPASPLQEPAINVESILYDSGFPLQTKYDLINFIAIRRDTFVVLSTHTSNGRVLSLSEEHSLAVALRTRLQMFPESDRFGTPVMRGMVMGRSCRLLNSKYTKRLPLSIEVAIKSAIYMGAGDGRWKNGKNFDGAPGSVLDYVYDLSITWVPATVRNKDWDVGLNWAQAYDMRRFFIPALKTAYDDDTSVLNSYFVAMAICTLNKITQAAHREFSGVDGLSNAQLVKKVNDFVTARVQGIFDSRYVIVPAATFTDMDLKRGYSWQLPVKIYAPNMKTVMTTYVQAYRISDLAAA